MNTLELTDKKEQLKAKASALIEHAKKESRKLNEEEASEFRAIKEEITSVEEELRKLNEELNKQENKVEKRSMENKFSLMKAINDIANNRPLDERAQEVVNAGMEEMRKARQSYSGQIVLPIENRATIQATVATQGQENVPEDKLGILEPLRANLVMVQAGATYMSGLVGDISIPVYSGSNVAWGGEVASASDGAGTFSEIVLQPKRLTAYLDVSKQFLIQDSNSAEDMLKRDIIAALTNKLEATILGNGDGKEGGANVIAPVGFFNGVVAEAAASTYSDIVDWEKTLELANVYGDIKFITSPAAKAIMKTTALDSGSGRFALENGELNGYPVLCTSNATSKGIIMGNFSDYVIAQWGGIDLVVDPYTQAGNGKVRLVINAYFDAKPRRATSFVKKILH